MSREEQDQEQKDPFSANPSSQLIHSLHQHCEITIKRRAPN